MPWVRSSLPYYNGGSPVWWNDDLKLYLWYETGTFNMSKGVQAGCPLNRYIISSSLGIGYQVDGVDFTYDGRAMNGDSDYGLLYSGVIGLQRMYLWGLNGAESYITYTKGYLNPPSTGGQGYWLMSWTNMPLGLQSYRPGGTYGPQAPATGNKIVTARPQKYWASTIKLNDASGAQFSSPYTPFTFPSGAVDTGANNMYIGTQWLTVSPSTDTSIQYGWREALGYTYNGFKVYVSDGQLFSNFGVNTRIWSYDGVTWHMVPFAYPPGVIPADSQYPNCIHYVASNLLGPYTSVMKPSNPITLRWSDKYDVLTCMEPYAKWCDGKYISLNNGSGLTPFVGSAQYLNASKSMYTVAIPPVVWS